MPYPNELHIKKLQAQKLQEIIRGFNGGNYTAEDLINSGVSVSIASSEACELTESMLRFTSDCIHKAIADGLELFQVNFSSNGEFVALYVDGSGNLVTHNGVKLFHIEMMSDAASESMN